MTRFDWIRGDTLGLEIPAHTEALRSGSAAFLTKAFHIAGSLPQDNRVVRVTECREVLGGSTGRKLLLSVEYDKPPPHLHNDLFVKFSRDFDDEVRDGAKVQMELEVWCALLSRSPEFPIAVPICYFCDYHHESGTGILITQRVPYGADGVEPHYSIWGCLSAAELFMWDEHLDELLGLFAHEFENCGGPALNLVVFKLHLIIYVAMMGLNWMFDVPQYILSKTPDAGDVKNRFDPRIESNERVRSQLLIMTAFLNLWEKSDMASVVDYMEQFE